MLSPGTSTIRLLLHGGGYDRQPYILNSVLIASLWDVWDLRRPSWHVGDWKQPGEAKTGIAG